MDSLLQEQAAEVAESLSRLMRRFTAIDTESPGADLPAAQFKVCLMLHFGPRTMTELSRELRISHSAVTQLADRLQKSGLVERVVEQGDHRVKCLRLTDFGRQVVSFRRSRRAQRVLDVMSNLSPDERAQAVAGLRTLLRALGDADRRTSEP